MKRYLTTTEVADDLDITVDALQAQIRSGQFVQPDAITGRIQGWLASTIQAWKSYDGHHHIIRFDSAKSFEHVAELRNISALVHAYGQADIGAPYDSPAWRADKRTRTAAIAVSDEIALTATKIESFARAVLANERMRAHQIDQIGLDEDDQTSSSPALQEIPLAAPNPTPLKVYLGAINPLDKAQHLRNAADTLEHLATAITTTTKPNRKIATYAAQIRDIADEIITNQPTK
ncbi:hypothetical protein BKG82_26100 [Mycobacteroides chelonae]|uniref:Uncharacterized protein n=1 Tax=Mycobacteroides chelonae TaxID=1774 RepID=A0A1S1LBW4_MYCCH|nr:hypothetical protein [Mycobacteroides chelonae]OHU47133.1 hypothetical protein BKG82_26100 [Mycobacteroides chelonae]